ncbi:MAG: ABC transporter substrate-binding protein [Nitrospirota bacterium]|nr:ABC transporter substrate-binding protein [Nitrospirota bacterium]
MAIRSARPKPRRQRTAGRGVCLAITIIMVLSLTMLAGCPGKKESDVMTIRFVTWKPNQPEAWEEILRIFHEENPGIRIEREIGPHSSTAFHDLLTQKLKNRSRDVDVFFMDVIWPAEFAAAGWAMPLDDFIAAQEREKFLEGAILANTFENRLYGIPLFVDSGMLYYRKDLLKQYGFKPPVTWQEMADISGKIVIKESKKGRYIYGFSGQFKQYEGLVCGMMEYILSNNGMLVDREKGVSAVTGKPAIEAVRFVRDRIIGGAAPVGVLAYQEPESLDLFIQGKAVFHRNWPYAWQIANDPQRSTIAGNVGIAKLPHFPAGKSYAALGGWQLGISSYSEHKEAAWKFVQFLASDRIQKLLAVRSGKAPTRKALYDDPEVLKANPHFRDMKDVFLSAYPRPVTPLYPALSNILQRYFSTVISDRQSDIAGEAENASREMNKLLSMTQ